MHLTSSAFKNEGVIPGKYTCDGEDVSPALSWTAAPDKTKSFALICDDPDAPAGTWVHWVMYNIPPKTKQLPESVETKPKLADDTRQGENDFGKIGYGGACPPPGHGYHRYFFKLYALDSLLDIKDKTVDKQSVTKAMKGHVLAESHLMGKYERK
ncbi:MAG: YbhB/YbcL family Raf kinase inhibitor-like protein [Candidatus Schekmanbacteria bacterium]|nr:YbhB/YbcL family Raf kinase inhibitor-like protein [Candidatus Schekmanbacteria bacterium]